MEVDTIGFGKDKRGVILRINQTGGSLGALAANTALALASFAPGEDFRMLKLELFAQANFSDDADSCFLVLASGKLTVAEVDEALRPTGAAGITPQEPGDIPEEERAERPVWLLHLMGSHEYTANRQQVQNGGRAIEFKRPWTYPDTEGFVLYAYNPNAFPLTTGGSVQLYGTAFGVWVK